MKRAILLFLAAAAAPAAAQLDDSRKVATSATLVPDNRNAIVAAEHVRVTADTSVGDRLANLLFDRELGRFTYDSAVDGSNLNEGEFAVENVNSVQHRRIFIDPETAYEGFIDAHWRVGFRFYVGSALLELQSYSLQPGQNGSEDFHGHYSIVSGSLPSVGATNVRVHTEGDIPYLGDLAAAAFTGAWADIAGEADDPGGAGTGGLVGRDRSGPDPQQAGGAERNTGPAPRSTPHSPKRSAGRSSPI